MVFIKFSFLNSLKNKNSVVGVAAIMAVCAVSVPAVLIGYSDKNGGTIDKASSIVEVEPITEEVTATGVDVTNAVDKDIANVLGIEETTEKVTEADEVELVAEADSEPDSEPVKNYTLAQWDGLKANAKTMSDKVKTEKSNEKDTEQAKPEEKAEKVEKADKVVESTVVVEDDAKVEVEPVVEVAVEVVPPHYVYKPSTHYVHWNTCRWADSSCYEIVDTYDIEARNCTECGSDIEIITAYEEPVPEYIPTVNATELGVDSYDRDLLAQIVHHEAGSNWISQYNKAKVAAGVMNRVYDSRFPGTVYGVLTQPYQFSGFWPGNVIPTSDDYDAVDYYFSHTSEFNSDNSWYGDGYQNHFYYQ